MITTEKDLARKRLTEDDGAAIFMSVCLGLSLLGAILEGLQYLGLIR